MPVAVTGARHVGYVVALAVHVCAALVGFGTLAVTGVYASWGRHYEKREAVDDLRRYLAGGRWAGWGLWVVPVAGLAALAVGPGVDSARQLWVIIAFLCWVAAAGLAVGVIGPAERQLRSVLDALEQTPPDGESTRARLAAACRRLAWAAGACDVSFATALVLMVFRPGA